MLQAGNVQLCSEPDAVGNTAQHYNESFRQSSFPQRSNNAAESDNTSAARENEQHTPLLRVSPVEENTIETVGVESDFRNLNEVWVYSAEESNAIVQTFIGTLTVVATAAFLASMYFTRNTKDN